MFMHIFHLRPQQTRTASSMRWALAASILAVPAWAVPAQPVPGYVAPVAETPVAPYVDDTRGVYVPQHEELRQKTNGELNSWNQTMQANLPLYAQTNPNGQQYQRALNTVADGVPDTSAEINRISNDPGLIAGGQQRSDIKLYGQDRFADNTPSQGFDGTVQMQLAQNIQRTPMPNASYGDISPAAGPGTRQVSAKDYPSLATGGQARTSLNGPDLGSNSQVSAPMSGEDGQELAVGNVTAGAAPGTTLDLQNSVVRLKEERISVRRALQRMLDQIGGGGWTVVWDLDESNAGLPDMEISIYAEEPFIKVMNALLARLQTRSGQPIRVIKYDKTQRLVITDRTGGDARSAAVSAGGGKAGADMAVTETVLKESSVSLHYDEVPLVDALENIVNQAGKGQWRLRMYAGTDQVLKPAHVEEPFGVALERILKIFNLRYEIFPGGKLIVVTNSNSFGFRGVE